ncbi:TrbG/VirB9 family P-type conjugative transfer protein [Sphingomonas oryzagri]
MRRLLGLGAVAGALLSGSVTAATNPRPGPLDPRVTFVNYDANQVYRISGSFRHALQIQFSPNEVVTQAALGDTVSWEIVPVGNMLFLKPREKGRPTNLIVLTSYLGTTRSYHFELGINSGPKIYEVRFRYPAEEARAAAELAMLAQQKEVAAVEDKVVNTALDHAVIEGKRNLDYWLQGASDLAPSEASDNGEFTVLRYPGHADIPSIFAVNGDGTETIVPYDVREDYVVLHGVWHELRLRKGGLVLCITNRGPLRNERGTRTGTASPIVERQVRGSRP